MAYKKKVQASLGSGVIELAHRTVVQKRMKLSGQRCTIEGTQHLLNLRVIKMNEQWSKIIGLTKRQFKNRRLGGDILKCTQQLLLVNETGKHKKIIAFIKRPGKNSKSIFVFLDNNEVPFDNNASERAIRMVKIKTGVGYKDAFEHLKERFDLQKSGLLLIAL